MLTQRWANIASLTNFHPKTTWHAYVGPMLGKHNAFNIKDNQIMSPVYIGPTLVQRNIFNKLLS